MTASDPIASRTPEYMVGITLGPFQGQSDWIGARGEPTLDRSSCDRLRCIRVAVDHGFPGQRSCEDLCRRLAERSIVPVLLRRGFRPRWVICEMQLREHRRTDSIRTPLWEARRAFAQPSLEFREEHVVDYGTHWRSVVEVNLDSLPWASVWERLGCGFLLWLPSADTAPIAIEAAERFAGISRPTPATHLACDQVADLAAHRGGFLTGISRCNDDRVCRVEFAGQAQLAYSVWHEATVGLLDRMLPTSEGPSAEQHGWGGDGPA